MNRQERRKLKVIGQRKAMASAEHGRPCGECTACCWTMGVEPLGKPMYEACKYVTSTPTAAPRTGCTIYADKPRCCSTFYCVWKYDQGEVIGLAEEDRPDRSGVVLIPPSDPGLLILLAHPAWPGSLNTDTARKLIRKLVFFGNCIASDDGMGLVNLNAPPDKYNGAHERLSKLSSFTAGPLGGGRK